MERGKLYIQEKENGKAEKVIYIFVGSLEGT